MKVVWTNIAEADMKEILNYVSLDSSNYSRKIYDTIIENITYYLLNFPEIGRIGRVQRTREFIIRKTNYIVTYEIKDNKILILSVRNSIRLWPSSF
jgi:toxin ParE1/3/4